MSQSPNPAAPQQVAPLLALATQLLRAGRPADAIAPLRDAAQLQPSDPIIQHDLGLACLEVGHIPDAIAALQRAVASNPRYTDAYFRLGICASPKFYPPKKINRLAERPQGAICYAHGSCSASGLDCSHALFALVVTSSSRTWLCGSSWPF